MPYLCKAKSLTSTTEEEARTNTRQWISLDIKTVARSPELGGVSETVRAEQRAESSSGGGK